VSQCQYGRSLHSRYSALLLLLLLLLLLTLYLSLNAGCAARRSQSLEIVTLLLEDEEIDVNLADVSDGDTPLHGAAEAGREDILQKLLDDPRVDLEVKNFDG
jgi:ankyrin repeat protein